MDAIIAFVAGALAIAGGAGAWVLRQRGRQATRVPGMPVTTPESVFVGGVYRRWP